MNGNGAGTDIRLVVVVGRDDDMTVEGGYFLAYFLLESDTGSHGDDHRNHSEGDGYDGDFYYWCGNTTFMVFGSNKSVRYKIF
jgi:hypothetical protein